MRKYKIDLLGTFYKSQLPDKIPEEIEKVIDKLKKSEGKSDCLKKAYEILTSKYKGFRFRTLIFPHYLLINNLESLWNKSGFIYCNQINYLLRILLVESSWFEDEDIELKWTLIWYISPHQYCRIKMAENKYINVDIWERTQGFQFGDYAHGFHSGEKFETIIDFTKIKKGGIKAEEILSRLEKLKKK